MSEKKIKDIHTAQPELIDYNSSVLDAAKLMAKQHIGFVPVYKDNKDNICGILTDRDIVIRALAAGKNLNSPLGEFMTKEVHFIDGNADLVSAAKLMKDKKVRRLVVKENNKIVGVISLGDLSTASHNTPQEKSIIEALYGVSTGPSSQ